MMRLKRVVYELFDSDLGALDEGADSHEIDRELFLEFENGERRYISWCSFPEPYSVGVQDRRFNVCEPDHIIDVSDWDSWKDLIGDEVQMIFQNPTHQVLEIKGRNGSVYLSTQRQGSWSMDVLHISTIKPELPGMK